MMRFVRVLCLLSLVACHYNQREQGVFVEKRKQLTYDALIDLPTFRMFSTRRHHQLSVWATTKKSEPSKATLFIENVTELSFSRDCTEAKLFADGVPVPLGDVQRAWGKYEVDLALKATLSAEALAQLRASTRVTAQACEVTFALNEPQVAALREFAAASAPLSPLALVETPAR